MSTKYSLIILNAGMDTGKKKSLYHVWNINWFKIWVKSDKMYSNLYKSFISFETALSLLEIYPNKYSQMCAHLHIKDILNPYWILKKWVIQKSNNWLLIIAGDSVAVKICFWNIYYENIKVHRKKYFKLLEKCLSSHKNVYL